MNKTDYQNLSVLPDEVDFVEKLLNSKGLMFVKKDSTVFPFSKHHTGFVYEFFCTTYVKIEVLDILNQVR